MVIQQGGEAQIPRALLKDLAHNAADIEWSEDQNSKCFVVRLVAKPSCRDCGANIPAGHACETCNSQPVVEIEMGTQC